MRAIAAVAAAGFLLVGCGLQAGSTAGSKAGPTTSGTSAGPAKPPVSCVHLKPSPGQATVSLTAADNHGSFCVRRGTGIFVFLHEATLELWAPIQSSSPILEVRPSGRLSLIRGETGGFFLAVAVGTATLTSFEPRCIGGPHPGAKRSSGRCPAPLRFAVTVHVLS